MNDGLQPPTKQLTPRVKNTCSVKWPVYGEATTSHSRGMAEVAIDLLAQPDLGIAFGMKHESISYPATNQMDGASHLTCLLL